MDIVLVIIKGFIYLVKKITKSLKNIFLITLVWLYVFIFLGFVFHTSYSHQILNKYSSHYFIFLVFLVVFFLPYLKFIKFLWNTSDIKYKKNKFRITSAKKIYGFLLSFLLLILIFETYFRIDNIVVQKSIYTVDNYHPFLQVRLTSGLGEKYHINSLGYRNNEFSKEKDSGTYRIVLVGGSTVENVDVPFENTVSNILEEKLRNHGGNFEVINAGVGGYTSLHSLIDYMTRIRELNPDLIIMWHGVNDMFASCSSIPGGYRSDYSHTRLAVDKMVSQYFSPVPLFKLHLITFDYILEKIQKYMYTDFIKNLETRNGIRRLLTTKEIDTKFESIDSYERNLEYFIAATNHDNTKLILGNQSTLFSKIHDYKIDYSGITCYTGEYHAGLNSLVRGMNEFNLKTEEVAQKNNISFIDFDNSISKSKDNFVDIVHWSKEGNEKAANVIFDYLISNSIVNL